MRRARSDAGLTLVEIMVSVLLVGIAAAFVFSIQVRTSQALRDQSSVAELQMTLRSANDVIVRDLRLAGYLAKVVQVNDPNTGTPVAIAAIDIVNSGSAPDELKLVYADSSTSIHITSTGPNHNASETSVDSVSGIQVGDVLMAVNTDPDVPQFGQACTLQVTDVQTGGGGIKFQHNPGTGAPWNTGSNNQCSNLDGAWNDYPYTIFVRVALRAYRIRPNDPRGILEVSPSAGVANDWIPIAVGIVDMQLAINVHDSASVVDTDGDGSATDNWYSNGVPALDYLVDADANLKPDNYLREAAVTLLGRTTKDVASVAISQTPNLWEGDKAHNRLGDRDGTALPVTDTSSMYYGSHVYRTYTATVDLRNLGLNNF